MPLLITTIIFFITFWYLLSISREVIRISKLRIFKRKLKNKQHVFVVQKKFLGLFWISAIDTSVSEKKSLVFKTKSEAEKYVNSHNEIKKKNLNFF